MSKIDSAQLEDIITKAELAIGLAKDHIAHEAEWTSVMRILAALHFADIKIPFDAWDRAHNRDFTPHGYSLRYCDSGYYIESIIDESEAKLIRDTLVAEV